MSFSNVRTMERDDVAEEDVGSLFSSYWRADFRVSSVRFGFESFGGSEDDGSFDLLAFAVGELRLEVEPGSFDVVGHHRGIISSRPPLAADAGHAGRGLEIRRGGGGGEAAGVGSGSGRSSEGVLRGSGVSSDWDWDRSSRSGGQWWWWKVVLRAGQGTEKRRVSSRSKAKRRTRREPELTRDEEA